VPNAFEDGRCTPYAATGDHPGWHADSGQPCTNLKQAAQSKKHKTTHTHRSTPSRHHATGGGHGRPRLRRVRDGGLASFGGLGVGEGCTAADLATMRFGPELNSNMKVSATRSGKRITPEQGRPETTREDKKANKMARNIAKAARARKREEKMASDSSMDRLLEGTEAKRAKFAARDTADSNPTPAKLPGAHTSLATSCGSASKRAAAATRRIKDTLLQRSKA